MFKVLIAEDEDIIRKGLAYTIDWLSIGYVLAGEAANGEEGIEKIISLRPDVVIADIMMPKVNGMEMIREAAKQAAFKSIILTSYAEFEYARQAIELKAYEYMMKPVSVDQLKETMIRLKGEMEREQEKELLYEQKNSGMGIDQIACSESYKNPYVKQAIELMQKHFQEKLSIEGISDELKVSASYLSRRFREETGHTYLDFLNQYRVQQAVHLLDQGTYRVYQISDMTGFTDYKHFCTVFKRYLNVSPSEFLRKKKEKSRL